MRVTRRAFVSGGVSAFAFSFAAPRFLSELALAQGASTRSLVVLYLGGGNDALSMLVPYNDASYRERRPTLAAPVGTVLQIGTDSSNVALGLHPRGDVGPELLRGRRVGLGHRLPEAGRAAHQRGQVLHPLGVRGRPGVAPAADEHDHDQRDREEAPREPGAGGAAHDVPGAAPDRAMAIWASAASRPLLLTPDTIRMRT